MNENTAEFWNLFLLQQNVTRYFYLLLVVAVKTGQSVTFCSHNQNKQTRSKFSAASRNFGCIALRWSGSGSAIKDHSDHMCSSLKEAMNLLPEWIHQFLWCTMIWGILDLWSWSRLPQKFPLYSIMYHMVVLFICYCCVFHSLEDSQQNHWPSVYLIQLVKCLSLLVSEL